MSTQGTRDTPNKQDQYLQSLDLDRPLDPPKDSPDWAVALFQNVSLLHKRVDKAITRLDSEIDDNTTRIGSCEKQISSLREDSDDHTRLINALICKIAELEAKSTALENYSRRENILFHHVPDTGAGESPEKCVQSVRKILADMGVPNATTLAISACHRVGRHNPRRQRSIVVRFVSRFDRDAVFQKRSNCPGKITVTGDLAQITRNRRQYMVPIFVRAKKSTKYANKVKLIEDRLILAGKTYTIDNYKSLPADLLPAAEATKTKDNVTLFYSIFSPLSNFYPAQFISDNVCFQSSEQYYQYFKAKACCNDDVAGRILAINDPMEAKRLGKRVNPTDDDDWNPLTTMKHALLHKFTQHPELAEILTDTGCNTLGESAPYDKYWGTGLKMSDADAYNPVAWSAKNNLGRLLMEVRSELANITDC